MIDDKSLEIHRIVSNHVLKYIPIKPKSAANLKFPIGFMTDQCRLAAKSEDNDSLFSSKELKLAVKLLPWSEGIDSEILKFIADNIRYYEKGIGEEYNVPLVIRALSGKGKTMLFGKIIAQLIYDYHDQIRPENKEIKSKRILFSQLKDNLDKENLESSICSGLDKYHHHCTNIENLDAMMHGIDDKIILIDSLDEHPARKEWWDVSMKFSKYGWKVVWSCRDPDFNRHNLADRIPIETKSYWKRQRKKDPCPWDLLKGFSWDLKLDERRSKQLSEYLDSYDLTLLTDIKKEHREFYQECYSKTQLMNIFYTNLSMVDKKREDLDRLLLTTIIDNKEHVKKQNIQSKESDLTDKDWYPQFFDSLLTKLIIDSSLNFLTTEVGQSEPFENLSINDVWNQLCLDFYKIRNQGRGIISSELDETLPEVKTDDKPTKALTELLTSVGILRQGNKFRHRDFAVVAYLQGCKIKNGEIKLSPGEKDDLLFSFLNPISKIYPEGTEPREANHLEVINDFLRRTGNIIGHINPILKLVKQKVEIGYIIARQSLIHKGDSDYETIGLTPKQTEALRLSEDRRSIILKGFPGSGKTYAGVERIIFRQCKQHAKGVTNSKSLIVSLNDQLANSIRNELHSRHKNSKYLHQETNGDKTAINDILYNIEVRSLKNVIEEWLPEVTQGNNQWHLGKQETYSIFTKLKKENSEISEKDWRKLEKEFQNDMYDDESGKLIKIEDYVEKDTEEEWDYQDKERWKKVRRLWHGRLKNRREKYGQISTVEASIVLRNQLLWYEHQKSPLPNNQWNSNFHISLDGNNTVNKKEIFDRFENLFSKGKYDQIMVDEVQDLPAISIIALSFLSPNRTENRFVIAGDRDQTINGQQFVWRDYLKRLSYISREVIAKSVGHIYTNEDSEPTYHHLKGLSWTSSEIDEVTQFHLTDNHRNHSSIVDYTKESWNNWPTKGYAKEAEHSKDYPLDKMKSTWKGQENHDLKRIMEIQTSDKRHFVESLEEVLTFLQTRARISLLIPNQWLRSYIKNGIMEEKPETKLDSYDAWTIKGLERDAVVMICPYTASPKDSDSAILMGFDSNSQFTIEQSKAVDLIRRKLLVSNTRAVQQLIILHPPKNMSTNLGHDQVIKCLNPPNLNLTEKVGKGQDITQQMTEFFHNSDLNRYEYAIATVAEGIDLFTRAQSDVNQAEEIDFFMSRWEKVSKGDPEDSKLRALLKDIMNFSDDLSKCLILQHVFDRKFYGHNSIDLQNKINIKVKDDYSIMVDSISKYNKSLTWDLEGFKNLSLAHEKHVTMSERIRNFEVINQDRVEEKRIKSDIKKVHRKMKNIINRQITIISPKLMAKDKHYDQKVLARSLFTEAISLERFGGEVSDLSNISFDFSKILIQSFDKHLRLNDDGYVATLSEGILNQKLWQGFISRLIQIDDKQQDKAGHYSEFAVHLCNIYHQKLVRILSEDQPSRNKSIQSLYKPFFDALRLINSLNEQEINKTLRSEISFYFNNIHADFTNYIDKNSDEQYKKLVRNYLDEALKIDRHAMDEISDDSVAKWKLHDFTVFVKALGNQRQIITYQKRINTLVIESGIFDKEIHRITQNLVEKSLLSQEQQIITEDKLFDEIYSKLKVDPVSKDNIGFLLGFGMRDLGMNLRKNPDYLKENSSSSKFYRNTLLLDYILKDNNLNLGFLMKDDNENLPRLFENLNDITDTNRAMLVNEFERIVTELYETLENMKSRITNEAFDLSSSQILSSEYTSILTGLRLINIFLLRMPPIRDQVIKEKYQSLIFSNPSLVQVSGKLYVKMSDYRSNNPDYISTIKEIYDNWVYHSLLNKLVARNQSKRIENNFRIPYELGCYGLDPMFDSWMSNNDILYESMSDERNDIVYLFDNFDLQSRIEKLISVSKLVNKVLQKSRTKSKRIKTLMQNIIYESRHGDLFDIYSKLEDLNHRNPKAKKHIFYFCVYGRDGGEVPFSLSRNGTVKVETFKSLKPTELYAALEQIGLDMNSNAESVSKDSSIFNLEESIEGFKEILLTLKQQDEKEIGHQFLEIEDRLSNLANVFLGEDETEKDIDLELNIEKSDSKILQLPDELDLEVNTEDEFKEVRTHYEMSLDEWANLPEKARLALIELFKNTGN